MNETEFPTKDLTEDQRIALMLTIPEIGWWFTVDDWEAIEDLCDWAGRYAVTLYLSHVPDTLIEFIKELWFAGGENNGHWARDPEG